MTQEIAKYTLFLQEKLQKTLLLTKTQLLTWMSLVV